MADLLSVVVVGAGLAGANAALVAPRTEYERLGIDLMLGRKAVKLEPKSKRIRLDGDEVIPYDRLLIATGGRKRRLS